MRRAARRVAAALVAVTCLGALAACGGGDDVETGTDPLEVEVGEAFSWNSFTVEEGWELQGIQRSVDMQEVTTPQVTGTITNESDESRAAIFQMVFSAGDDPLATVNCSAGSMGSGQSEGFICPGINTTMPQDYDTVTVREFVRDTGAG